VGRVEPCVHAQSPARHQPERGTPGAIFPVCPNEPGKQIPILFGEVERGRPGPDGRAVRRGAQALPGTARPKRPVAVKRSDQLSLFGGSDGGADGVEGLTRECMHRVVDAKALPGFGAGRGEGLSRRRPEVNGLMDLSDAPAALARAAHAQDPARRPPREGPPAPSRVTGLCERNTGGSIGPFPPRERRCGPAGAGASRPAYAVVAQEAGKAMLERSLN